LDVNINMSLTRLNIVLFGAIVGAVIRRYQDEHEGVQDQQPETTTQTSLPIETGTPPTTEDVGTPPTTEDVGTPPTTEDVSTPQPVYDSKDAEIQRFLDLFDQVRPLWNVNSKWSRHSILTLLKTYAKWKYKTDIDKKDIDPFWRGEYDLLLSTVLSIPNKQIEAIAWNIKYHQNKKDIDYNLMEQILTPLRGKLVLPFTIFQILHDKKIMTPQDVNRYLSDFNYPDSTSFPHVIIMWLREISKRLYQEQTDDEKVLTIKKYMWWVNLIRPLLNILNPSSRSSILYVFGQAANLYHYEIDKRDRDAFWRGDYDPLLKSVLSVPNEQIEAIIWSIQYRQKPVGSQDIDYDKIERVLETLRGKLLLPFTLFQFLESNNYITEHELKNIYLNDFNKPNSTLPHTIVLWLQTLIRPTP